jgi:tRNA pseudouridine38-40 synthase
LRGAGRTDAGVHALDLPADFATPYELDLDVLLRAWNAVTPRDLTIREVRRVPDGFSARRQARQRTYRYVVDNRRHPSPFLAKYTWHVTDKLDLDAMRRAMSHLVGEHDFSSFRASDCEAKSAVRRIHEASVQAITAAELAGHAWWPFGGSVEAGLIAFTVRGTAFLKHQVRATIGTVLDVGRGHLTADDFGKILAARDRQRAGITAPAHGLTLVRVDFSPQSLVD